MDPSISVSLSYGGDFLDSHPQKGLLVAGWLPPMPSPIDSQYRTALAFACLEALLQIAYGISLLGRP